MERIEPPDCTPEAMREGVVMLVGGCCEAIEALVQRCRRDLELTAKQVDWHYVGGRGIVRAAKGNQLSVKEWFRGRDLSVRVF